MKVAVRLLDLRLLGWGFPCWGSSAAAGLDLHACLDGPMTLEPQGPPALISAGFAVRIRDPDWCGLVLPRSGRGHRDGLVMGNGTGVIDADYEGPILVSAWNRNPRGDAASAVAIAPGDRIAQLVFTRIGRPTLEIAEGVEADAADTRRRGSGGFGSTGR